MTLDRRTLVLGIAAAGAVAAAATVTAVNHKSKGSPERRAVTDYINSVNAIQHRMTAPLTRVMFAYRDFTAKGGSKEAAPRKLAAAAATLQILERRLVALPYPPEARTLRTKLVVLIRREADVTREVQLLAGFAPRYVSTLRAVRAASGRLDEDLAKIDIPEAESLRGTKRAVARARRKFAASAQQAAAAQAAAIEEYDRTVTRVLARLARLRPPPALAPQYRAQIAALHAVTAAGAQLSTHLRGTDRSGVPALSRRFSLASRTAETLAVQRAQIAAVRAYDKRGRDVGAAAAAVQTELARLQRNLP